LYPSLFTACTIALTFANFSFLGFVVHRLWRRDEEERKARVEADKYLQAALVKAYADQSIQNVNMFETMRQQLTFNHNNIATCVATVQHNNNELLKSHEASLKKILDDAQTANQLLAQTLKPVIDWVYISEAYVREFRAMKMKTPPARDGGDTCGHCKKKVQQYFIDGAGRTTCASCKPEGFRDAVDRGIARL